MTRPISYVVVTPARNEGQFIELTIRSMLSQTIRPAKWVIVSDGSTDATDEIVGGYAAEHPWIELVRLPAGGSRSFSGKVYAFNAGYARLEGMDYDAIASLDGDISFESDYFSFLLGRLAGDPALGLVGTPFEEGAKPVYDFRFVSIEHVSGACQLFRRSCFEQIGGYRPLARGGVDRIAVITARMKGWQTRTFTGKACTHHRLIGTAEHGVLAARFKVGAKDYALGNFWLWEIFRTGYQMTKRPFLIGGLAVLSGYTWALVRRAERPVEGELLAFQQREQLTRLRKLFLREQSNPL